MIRPLRTCSLSAIKLILGPSPALLPVIGAYLGAASGASPGEGIVHSCPGEKSRAGRLASLSGPTYIRGRSRPGPERRSGTERHDAEKVKSAAAARRGRRRAVAVGRRGGGPKHQDRRHRAALAAGWRADRRIPARRHEGRG